MKDMDLFKSDCVNEERNKVIEAILEVLKTNELNNDTVNGCVRLFCIYENLEYVDNLFNVEDYVIDERTMRRLKYAMKRISTSLNKDINTSYRAIRRSLFVFMHLIVKYDIYKKLNMKIITNRLLPYIYSSKKSELDYSDKGLLILDRSFENEIALLIELIIEGCSVDMNSLGINHRFLFATDKDLLPKSISNFTLKRYRTKIASECCHIHSTKSDEELKYLTEGVKRFIDCLPVGELLKRDERIKLVEKFIFNSYFTKLSNVLKDTNKIKEVIRVTPKFYKSFADKEVNECELLEQDLIDKNIKNLEVYLLEGEYERMLELTKKYITKQNN